MVLAFRSNKHKSLWPDELEILVLDSLISISNPIRITRIH